MKLEITINEQGLINQALEVQMAAVKRAINTEKDEDVKNIRKHQLARFEALRAKINTQELQLNETQLSKQKN